ncbi:protein jagged-2-like [Thrips palmi]|uniref:Protein jagged-2-like n=1 Tax=Thrips palmi TaxID=161013 RepID=A0A6P8YJ71_THRPL|nr:protein jagged-2-like [Thrips palmi]
MKWIVSAGVLAVAALVAVHAGPTITKACIANDSWKQDCNDCICSETGQPMCTRRVCPSPTTPRPQECTPGTVWRQRCNSCRCTASGMSICTQMACINDGDDLPAVGLPLPQPLPDHSRPTGHLCREGHTWKQDCNTCRCTGGRAACTMMACLSLGASGAGSGLENPSLLPAFTGGHQGANVLPATTGGHESAAVLPAAPAALRGEECTPGDTWKEDCNSCRCLPSHQPACTMARCVTKREVPAPALGAERRPCTVGDVWKDDCNTCRCGPTGEPACTKIGCIKLVKPDEQAAAGNARVARAAQNSQFPPQGHRGPGQVGCVSGTQWKQDCNTCNCINGREVCTFALCVGQ